jgi:ADP-ribosyl-[dinitrogen reductase] hydrolase
VDWRQHELVSVGGLDLAHAVVCSLQATDRRCALLIGAHFADDADSRRQFVTASTLLTHTDPKADWAAQAVAACVAMETQRSPATRAEIEQQLSAISADETWQRLLSDMFCQLHASETVATYASSLGLARGVTGYALHSVPVAIYAWLAHRHNFEAALIAALDCGGDTDSVGAVVGAIAGAALGAAGLPKQWLAPICDWPFGPHRLRKLAFQLAHQRKPALVLWPLVTIRNLVVLILVLGHGVRRMFPPYG